MKSKDVGVGCLLSDTIESGFISGEVVSPVGTGGYFPAG